MKFESRHLLCATLKEIETSFVDKRYPPFLLEHHPLVQAIQVLEIRLQNSRLTRRIQYLPKPLIHSIGPKKVEPSWFSFTEYSTYDFESKILHFSNEPDNMQVRSMLSNQGELRFSSLGDKTERIASGNICLCLPERLRFLGAMGEYLIQHEGLKILRGEISVMERFAKEVLRAPASPP
ncbi:MAG: hypothetical protein FWG75_07735 [Cystobacterineae bacterium]|nr:hypothetical protein [Cystobacterineae bacterium]